MKNTIKLIIAFIGAEIIKSVGGIDTIFKSLILMMLIDYFTGILKAAYTKNLDSQVGFFGIMKKILMLLLIVVAQQIDIMFKEEGIELICRDTVIIFYIINELVSILENAGEFIPIPDKLREILSQLKLKGDKNGEQKHI